MGCIRKKKHYAKRLARTWRRQMGRNICSERLYAAQFLEMPDPRINLDDCSDRVAGCLVGLAVGDTLGAPLEFLTRQEVRKRFPQGLGEMIASSLWDKGEYTDDTQMALLIAESLVENKDFIASDFAKRFQNWTKTAKDVWHPDQGCSHGGLSRRPGKVRVAVLHLSSRTVPDPAGCTRT